MSKVNFYVLYGSQTGCAKDIAESIHSDAASRGLSPSPTLLELNASAKSVDWDKPTVAIIVCSTTGNGEPPENAERFWRWLRRRSHPTTKMQQLYFGMLALGDTNYTKFCEAGKSISRRLEDLGAMTFHPLACADDATGLEETVSPWIASVWTPVESVLKTVASGKLWDPSVVADSTPPAPAPVIVIGDDGEEKKVETTTTTTTTTTAPFGASAGAGAGAAPSSTTTTSDDKDLLPSSSQPSHFAESGLSLGVLPFDTLFPAPEDGSPYPLPFPDKPSAYAKPPACLLTVTECPPPVDSRTSPTPLRRHRRRSSLPDCGETASTLSTTGGDVRRGGAAASMKHPYQAPIKKARYLTTGGEKADRRVLHVELDVTGCGMTYTPGDAIGVLCPNEADVVDLLVPRLGMDLEAWVDIESSSSKSTAVAFPRRSSLRNVFLRSVDITTVPKKSFVALLAKYASGKDAAVLKLLSAKRRTEYWTTFVEGQRLSLLDLLILFPSCKPPVAHLLSALAPLPPRYYSIASSPLADPDIVVVALSVVHYECPVSTAAASTTVRRFGLCSNWLERKASPLLDPAGEFVPLPVTVPVFLKPTKDFILPGNPEWPIVMIGPGTGVAPFIGFLQHRAHRVAQAERGRVAASAGTWRSGVSVEVVDDREKPVEFGDMVLFFGNRHPDVDFLYKEEMEGAVEAGVLRHLHLAFSRETDKKVYVQHRMREHGAYLADLFLNQSAVVYVCGDGSAMAKDVDAALVEILQTHGDLTRDEALSTLLLARQQHRYLQDIWS